MENKAQTPHRMANEVTELISRPLKKNSPKSGVQKNVIRIILNYLLFPLDGQELTARLLISTKVKNKMNEV